MSGLLVRAEQSVDSTSEALANHSEKLQNEEEEEEEEEEDYVMFLLADHSFSLLCDWLAEREQGIPQGFSLELCRFLQNVPEPRETTEVNEAGRQITFFPVGAKSGGEETCSVQVEWRRRRREEKKSRQEAEGGNQVEE
ncbi:unnamed protein product [Pleuronectes platessa]|uniref:Uncharacterized protein n=1 Tax=Pleuronectes platessa TaxID=8262 RepID=A0A9N7U0D5_PLEPL|nr:unnamed protein product [Pleuronectes platessa]